jgi:hypothetical protein
MCDYSLHGVASRPARVGDKLTVTKFPGTITRGFAACDAPMVAVCLRPGSELAFDRDARYGWWLPFVRRKKVTGRLARFRLINADRRDAHHDALEFADGTIVLLTCLHSGQRVTVLQLPADPQQVSVAEDEKPSMPVAPVS